MAKKIDRSRIEAGRFEIPKKLAFLRDDNVDYVAINDKDGGEWTVEISSSALSRLVKAKRDLKSAKGEHKTALSEQAAMTQAAEAQHAETRDALAKAERRIKALEKKLANTVAAPAAGASAPEPAKSSASKPSTPKATAPAAPVVAVKKPPRKLSAPKADVAGETAVPALATAVDQVLGAQQAASGPITIKR